ncbi:uncharacterized protein LOC127807770 isoform X2 [Diospyros lotus]|uniref:uncharacterized protein LOC127807770 isoform X2 n=1 Tax=Diospyros lotus TaxID=55363 RepID=UPI002252A09E|nr:uncharacterized protein LOC127807770 isoform X2 [Diospyros lotus]XP_052201806.1 uncharacterized protein LOC127807770 isoform X2 [Diospyros lotus]
MRREAEDLASNSRCKIKVMSHESPVKGEVAEVAYEGEDEHEENLVMKRDDSDFDFQTHVLDPNEEIDQSMNRKMVYWGSMGNKTNNKLEEGVDLIQSGHVSDPGIGKAEFWGSPKLKRSCSNPERGESLKILDQLPPNAQSFEELQRLAERSPWSPRSVSSHRSADKVMLKKHSSSQVLPSRSRKLWWKLFLWSHRNMHVARTPKPQMISVESPYNQQGGYCSETLEPNRGSSPGKMELGSPSSFTREAATSRGKNINNQNWDAFRGGTLSGFWPENQWVAFSTESPLTRVEEWVKELAIQPPLLDNDNNNNNGFVSSIPPETIRPPARSTSHSTRHPNLNLSEEILHANTVIRSLNSSSTVAHITGMGLKVTPILSQFSSLRSVNLSGNSIVHISHGSLPKGLHSLNLSRNKISTIEGFRELTRLRVLDLSYNRISRIGQGLSNCTIIKELYLAGNKISEVEGLHRLLKLSVIDLSFNKISTTKALGQLVANYNSLLALNLLGNPIQSNISDDQLRKAVCSLLPKLTYLNKQVINPHKGRDLATESVAKAALGNSSWSSRRKAGKRVTQGGSPFSSSGHRSSASVWQSKHRSKSHAHHHHSAARKLKSSELPSTSY